MQLVYKIHKGFIEKKYGMEARLLPSELLLHIHQNSYLEGLATVAEMKLVLKIKRTMTETRMN